MSKDWERVRFNPVAWTEKRAGITWNGEPWVVYNPAVKPQYRIIRQQSHDGLIAFTDELIYLAMMGLFKSESYYKPLGPPPDGFEPFYEVGTAKLATVYGRVQVPAGKIHGQRERLTIPVRVTYRQCKSRKVTVNKAMGKELYGLDIPEGQVASFTISRSSSKESP